MLLSNNSKSVIKFISYFDELNNVDKLVLCIHILESKYTKFNNMDIINLLKKILNKLGNNKDTIINFSKDQNLTFLNSKIIEFNETDKSNIVIEMLFNIYETDFNDNSINNEINQKLHIYNLTYELLNI